MTQPLANRFARVLAVELDEKIADQLASRFRGSPVEIATADALHDPLEPLLEAEAPWQMVSNLPYSVGSAILRRVLPRHDLFSNFVVMLQREVAARVVARPGDRNHGLLALERAAWTDDARIAFEVPPRAFRPRPRVMSSVVALRSRKPDTVPADLDHGLRLAAHALTQPRKMISNALRPLAESDHIVAADLDPRSRPADLSLDDWIRLSRTITG